VEFFSRFFHKGKIDLEGCSVSGFAIDGYMPSMLLHYFVDGREALSGAKFFVLSREERIKGTLLRFDIHSLGEETLR